MVEHEISQFVKGQSAKRLRKEISNLVICLDVTSFDESISYLFF